MGHRAEGSVLAVLVIALSVTTVGILLLPGDDADQRQVLSSGEPTGWNETSEEPWTPHAVKGDELIEPDEVGEDVEGPVPDDEKKG